ncbi:MAG: sigma-70 family RNA polymerase sigma factor [Pirellulaceae bacterium]|jgi:RNA polymerase sigma-70 factor (ECF subfamily)|nr:sigma-70 family RNA polymerase sigma factor [Pirellulaceae bacterium]HJN13350.1 sigma-70 family RNA polymerase sigma factor [Pirellulaceae bacterium]
MVRLDLIGIGKSPLHEYASQAVSACLGIGMVGTYDSEQDLELLRREGDQALAAIFSRYEQRLERMIRFRMNRKLWGRVDPADVLQEVYLESARRLPDYLRDEAVPVFVWLRGMTGQTLVGVHRRHLGAQLRDAGREVSSRRVGGPMATSISLAARLVADLTSPSHAAMRDEMLNELRVAFDQMDQIDREVLAMRHFEELTNNEVAEVLGLQKAASSNRYVRALKRLKIVLSNMPSFRDVED